MLIQLIPWFENVGCYELIWNEIDKKELLYQQLKLYSPPTPKRLYPPWFSDPECGFHQATSIDFFGWLVIGNWSVGHCI